MYPTPMSSDFAASLPTTACQVASSNALPSASMIGRSRRGSSFVKKDVSVPMIRLPWCVSPQSIGTADVTNRDSSGSPPARSR